MKDIWNRFYIESSILARNTWEKISEDLRKSDDGMATAEYAIVLVAATSFAGVLVAILKSETVRTILTKLITDALSVL